MANKEKDKKEYSISNDVVSDLARLVTGQENAQREFNWIMQGYENNIKSIMSEQEEKLSIDRDEVDVDWYSVLKNGKIYTRPKEENPQPKVEVGPEEKRPDDKQ